MARNRDGGGFDRFVVWLLAFVFFGPTVALKLTDSIDDVLLTMAPYGAVLGGVALAIYAFRAL